MSGQRSQSQRLRWFFALAMAAIVLCTVMVSVVVISASNARNATDVADDTVRRMGERTAELMLGHLDDAVESADQLVLLLTTDQLERRAADLDRLLAAQVRTVPQISGAFVGFPDGAFRFVSRTDDGLNLRRIDTGPVRAVEDLPIDGDLGFGVGEPVETEYDPRTRPWFEQALESDESTWTDPYVFFASQQPGVTLSQAIRSDRGELLGVVGIDLSLEALTQFLDGLPLQDEGEAFITAGDVIVAAPTGYDLTRRREDGGLEPGRLSQLDIGTEEFRALAFGREPIETDDGGRLQLIDLIDDDAPRWSVLVRTERTELSESVDRGARFSIVIVALTGLLLLLLIPLLTRSLRRAIDDLDRRATVDDLTDVLNRGAAIAAAEQAMDDARRTSTDLTVAVMDVDDFKRINDELGHPIGDRALADVGEVLVDGVRDRDIVGRIGGDEFMIAFRNVATADVEAALSRIQNALAKRYASDPEVPAPSLTIGVASRRSRAIDVGDLIAEADDALIRAKQTAKGSIAWAGGRGSDPKRAGQAPRTVGTV